MGESEFNRGNHKQDPFKARAQGTPRKEEGGEESIEKGPATATGGVLPIRIHHSLFESKGERNEEVGKGGGGGNFWRSPNRR